MPRRYRLRNPIVMNLQCHRPSGNFNCKTVILLVLKMVSLNLHSLKRPVLACDENWKREILMRMTA